jgi:cob(I)alamin adenosyltransferase
MIDVEQSAAKVNAMVRLDRITTRTGDDGTTGLADGRRLAKDHPLIAALGSVDEANSLLGLIRIEALPEDIAVALPIVQNDLFDLGADLATPAGGAHEERAVRIGEAYLARLDAWIVTANARLAALTSFVLPGGSRAAAFLHVVRTVVRRAERDCVHARSSECPPSDACIKYLNRLSDLCFVWARCCNDDGRSDVLWVPGGRP